MLDSGDTIRHAVAHRVVLKRQQIVVTVAAGDAQGWPAHQHARTRHIARVDCVAQGYVAVSGGAHVAHRCESGLQGNSRILRPQQSFARQGDRQALIPELGVGGKVSVGVNESGQNGGVREIDPFRVGRYLGLRRRSNAHNLFAFHHDDLIGEQLAPVYIQHIPGVHSHVLDRLLGDRQHGKHEQRGDNQD